MATLLSIVFSSCATPVDKAARLYERFVEAREEGDNDTALILLREYENIRSVLSQEERSELDRRLWDVLQ